ncbi:hypothetical protein PNA2_1202 [Pyrococcus sp. NA2]|uniref:hypothetical protein n=1 Tax=Pyrococcus sp. (strain NA2) TaxID=342949 RepID=UPI000209ABF1|nr:hypothetical protein [Pyrococcus sp. NA2]AEC52117.1 hypothetical protein PNA2_1202 [Pyrococcus sp. NA2]
MSEGVLYMVKLKYIEKAKLAVKREQKLAEFLPVFLTGGQKIPGKVEVRTRVYLPEFLEFAEDLGWEVKKRYLTTEDDYAYLRLLVYAVAMSVIKDPVKWDQLKAHVLSMEAIPLRYWSSKFRNVYWKYKNRGKLSYVARRFLEVELI